MSWKSCSAEGEGIDYFIAVQLLLQALSGV